MKPNKSVDTIIEKYRLPYMAQMLNANIVSVTFAAKIQHSPAPVIINSNTNDQINLSQISGWGELWKGQQSTNTIDIDTPFNLSINSADLEELMLIVKYNF